MIQDTANSAAVEVPDTPARDLQVNKQNMMHPILNNAQVVQAFDILRSKFEKGYDGKISFYIISNR